MGVGVGVWVGTCVRVWVGACVYVICLPIEYLIPYPLYCTTTNIDNVHILLYKCIKSNGLSEHVCMNSKDHIANGSWIQNWLGSF